MTTGLVPLEYLFDDERADSAGLGELLRNARATGIEMANAVRPHAWRLPNKPVQKSQISKGSGGKNISSALYV